MAKSEPWEERMRTRFESFARQVNLAADLVFMVNDTERDRDPELPAVDSANDPKWHEKLSRPAGQLFDIWSLIRQSIMAEEEGDTARFKQATEHLIGFIDETEMTLSAGWQDDQITVTRSVKTDTSEKQFNALVLTDWFLDYLARYRDIVHLGVCRQCGNVYLKPKHGQKMRYCSSPCRQKAYRRRKKDDEV